MKLFFFTALAMALTSVIAQRSCGSELSAEEIQMKEEHFAANKIDFDVGDGSRTILSINVSFHVVYESQTIGGGYVSDDQIAQQIRVLNADYANAEITFRLARITRTSNSDWFNNANPRSQIERAMKLALRVGGPRDLNVFAVGAISSSDRDLLGFATFPADYDANPRVDGVVLLFSSLPGGSSAPFNLGRTLTHETGHWLGLYHTFQNGCQSPGDYVSDTPAQRNSTRGCPTTIPDTCPDPGVDPIHNFMDYSNDSCLREFTSGQVDRLRAQIATYRGFPET